MDPDTTRPAPRPAAPARRIQPPAKTTQGLLITGLVIALFVLAIGVVATVRGPASAPACNGVTMSTSDTCVQTTYQGDQVTGTQTFTYNQMLASQQGFYSTAPWLIVVGAVVTAACGWGEYRWRRKRAFHRVAQSGKPV